MNKLINHWFSYGLIFVWFLMYMIGLQLDLVSGLANKGNDVINGQYHRFITTLFLHRNFVHVLMNAAALYWVGYYLEPRIDPTKLLLFALLIGVITEAIFSICFHSSICVGGSPVIFALIGLIAALQIMKESDFQLGTWYGNWILGYALFANIPLFSDNFISTLFIHCFPLALGTIFGCISVILRII